YQPDTDYLGLSESNSWRHVRYEPDQDPPVDFSWEREWRIKTDELALPAEEVFLILPGRGWARELELEHEHNEHGRIQMEMLAYGDWMAFQNPDPFHYRYSIIHV